MESHRISVAIALTSNHVAALGGLSRYLNNAQGDADKLNQKLGRLKLTIGGLFAVQGGAALLSQLSKVIDRGAELQRMQNNMRMGGMKEAEVAQATAKAWELTAKYRTLSVGRIGDMVNEVRSVFGDTKTAMDNIEPALKAATVLKSTMKGKNQEALVGQVFDMFKSADLRNITDDPKATAAYFDNMTKVVTATGGKVTPKDFLQMVKYSKSAGQTWTDDFITRIAASMMQEGSPSTVGTALASMDQAVVGGKMTDKALHAFDKLGLVRPDAMIFNKKGSLTEVASGGIEGGDLFRTNPYEWTQKVLKPAIMRQITDGGRLKLSEEDIIAKAAPVLSNMFGNRNAEWIANTMFKERPIERDKELINQAQGLKAADDLLKKDWFTAVEAFGTQWENLMTALGAPEVGSATAMLNSLTDALVGMNQWAARPENAKMVGAIFQGLAVGAAALTGAGAAALLAALGTAGWLVGGIVSMVGAWASVDPTGFKAAMGELRDVAVFAYQALHGFLTDPATIAAARAAWSDLAAAGKWIYTELKSFVTDPEVVASLKTFWHALADAAKWVYGQIRGFVTDPQVIAGVKAFFTAVGDFRRWVLRTVADFVTSPEFLSALKTFWTAVGSTAKAIYTSVKDFVVDYKVVERLSDFFGAVKSLAGNIVSALSGVKFDVVEAFTQTWAQLRKDFPNITDGIIGLANLMKSFNAISWAALKAVMPLAGPAVEGLGSVVAQFLRFGWAALKEACIAAYEALKTIDRWIGELRRIFNELSGEAFTKLLQTPLADIPKIIMTEVSSWPSRLTATITAMGVAIVDKLKEALNPLNWFGSGDAKAQGTSFGGGFGGGGGGGLGGLIHQASLGGGGGGGGFAGTPASRGAAGDGTGAGDSWYEAVMRAEGTSGSDPYNTVLGYGRYLQPPKPITQMTIDEVLAYQRRLRAVHGSASPVGAFQIVGNTLRNHSRQMGLSGSTVFSPEVQRRVADHIRRTEGWGAWEGFKHHRGELGRAMGLRGLGAGASDRGAAGAGAGAGFNGGGSAGGPVAPGNVHAGLLALKEDMAGVIGRVTALNDHFHHRKNPSSLHTRGLAMDVVGNPDKIIAAYRAKMGAAGLVEGRDWSFIDEYRKPSRHATGPHVHFQFRTREAAEAYARSRAKAAAPPPPTAPPPPKKSNVIEARHDIHLDGRKVASSVSRHMAQNARFPRHVGGMDGHGSWRPPGASVSDAA